MIEISKIVKEFERDGRVWLRNAIPSNELKNFKELSSLDGRPGARIPGNSPLYRAIEAASFNKVIRTAWSGMRPIRLISFDKNADANWGVPWHQDRVITVKDRVEMSGYSNWSRKSGTWHCEPPAKFLGSMLFVRVHLDRNTAESGAMEIALGSHREGKVPAGSAASTAACYEAELTAAEPGDVLVLAMLTLHRSLPAEFEIDRHVLRVDYSPFQLPEPLEWASETIKAR
ncbi:hypothetical protein A9Q97_01020 [Rhodospirillales bacterium 47_12_T64]|nr:hypothetical protein A9Q97_01020 [Rhodospirillales bacterium 47_12_T64]